MGCGASQAAGSREGSTTSTPKDAAAAARARVGAAAKEVAREGLQELREGLHEAAQEILGSVEDAAGDVTAVITGGGGGASSEALDIAAVRLVEDTTSDFSSFLDNADDKALEELDEEIENMLGSVEGALDMASAGAMKAVTAMGAVATAKLFSDDPLESLRHRSTAEKGEVLWGFHSHGSQSMVTRRAGPQGMCMTCAQLCAVTVLRLCNIRSRVLKPTVEVEVGGG